MQNNKQTITASELNKYAYCPHQWYYERLYGRKYIREQYNERNRALGLGDGVTSNFKKGLAFHRRHLFVSRLRLAVKIAALVVLAAVIGYFCIKGV